MKAAKFQTKEELISLLSDYFNNYPAVSAAYLFGSQATGKARAKSDVDVAVLFEPGLPAIERFDHKLTIGIDVERLTGKETDVVDLISAPPFLQAEVRRNGIIVLDKNKEYRINYEVLSRKKYFDMKPLLDRYYRAILSKY